MSKSALKMSKDSRVSYSTICRWIKKGYFGEIKIGKNGRYTFPDDMPLPYKSNGKVERDTTLLKKLIDASDLGRIVHKGMFPKIDSFRYDRILKCAVDAHLVEIRTPYAGVIQLVSTEEGRAVINATPKAQNRIYEKIIAGVDVAVVLAQLGIQYGPQLINALQMAS